MPPASGTITVHKVDGNNNYIEDTLEADDIPVSTGAGNFLIAGVSGTNIQDVFSTVADSINTKAKRDGDETLTGDKIFSDDVTILGNLSITGAQLTLQAENLLIQDNMITLNATVTGTPVLDAGIEVERGTSINSRLIWDEASDIWKIGLSGSESEVVTRSLLSDLDQSITFSTLGVLDSVSGVELQTSGNLKWKMDSIGDLFFNVDVGRVCATTSQGNDTAALFLAGGGTTSSSRGGRLRVYGNNFPGSEGAAILQGGNTTSGAAGEVRLDSPTASGKITMFSNGVERLRLYNDGVDRTWILLNHESNQSFRIAMRTSDGNDNQGLVLCGGGGSGTSRGAYLSMYGNETSEGSGGVKGWAVLRTGSVTGATLQLVNAVNNGPIQNVLSTGGSLDIIRGSTTQWQLDGSSKIVHRSHSGYTDSEYIRKTFAGSVTGTGSTDLMFFAVPDEYVYNITVRYTMNRASGLHAEGGILHAVVYRTGGGSATFAGTGVAVVSSKATGRTGNDPSISMLVSGNNVVIRLSGGVSGTMFATGFIEYQACPNSSS